MSYYHQNKKLPLDVAFTLDDISYPANWLRLANDEDKAAVGIEWRDDPQRSFKDERFYYNTVDSEGNVVSTPKNLDSLKRGMISRAKQTAHSMLSGSDWMVVREAEADLPLTDEWKEFRQSIRAECDRQEAAINTAADIEGLQAIKNEWPESPDEKAERERREAAAEAKAAEAKAAEDELSVE